MISYGNIQKIITKAINFHLHYYHLKNKKLDNPCVEDDIHLEIRNGDCFILHFYDEVIQIIIKENPENNKSQILSFSEMRNVDFEMSFLLKDHFTDNVEDSKKEEADIVEAIELILSFLNNKHRSKETSDE